MATYKVEAIIDGEPTFCVPLNLILAELDIGGALKVLSPLEYHTDRQRKWYRGICLKGLSDWNGDTVEEWDAGLKAECGGDELLNKETVYMGQMSNGKPVVLERRTIVGVGKRNMTTFIENILSKSIEKGWIVTPPDPELRINA